MSSLFTRAVGLGLTAALSLTSMTGFARTHSGGNTPGEFKGYDAINQALKARLVDQSFGGGSYFSLGAFFGDQTGGLGALLGSFSNGQFRNGAPNSLNMLLWYMGFSAFSGVTAKAVCEDHTAVFSPGVWQLSEGAYNAVNGVCDLPADATARESALMSLWLTVVAYDAPKAEFDAWAAFAGQQADGGATGSGLVASLLTAAFMNPYMLLEP